MKRSVNKTVICIIAAVIWVGLLCLAIYLKSVFDYKQAVNEITMEDVCISDLPDGVYLGGCLLRTLFRLQRKTD